MESRIDWKDARAVVLKQNHLAIKGLSRAKISGPGETLADGRVRLPIAVNAIFFNVSGTLTMRREVVLRAWKAGETEPELDWLLPNLRLTMAADGLGVTVPARDLADLVLDLERGMELSRFEAAWVWFLDGFTFGDDDPATISQQVEEQQGLESQQRQGLKEG